MPSARFDYPSASLTLKSLLKGMERAPWVGLVLAVGVHGALTQLRGLRDGQRVAKPLTTQFVKRQPRLTKPLELRKRPEPKRRRVQREMVAVRARMQAEERIAGFQPTEVLKGLARPGMDIGRVLAPQAAGSEPQAVAAAIAGTREAQQKIDLSLELLDISAMDTGQYHAMVIQDPQDKRNVKGFCWLAVICSEAMSGRLYPETGRSYFETFTVPVILNVADAMNRYTAVKTGMFGRITLDDAELLKTPWVYFMAYFNFRLSDIELRGLGKYLTSGGFVFADSDPVPTYIGGLQGLTGSIRSALEMEGIRETDFQRLPNSHPVYHCYFDFDMPPVGGDAPVREIRALNIPQRAYLEGLEVDGRLGVILSRKAYDSPWGGNWGTPKGSSYRDLDPKPALRFAVNLVVFALTQEGSITRRLMDSVAY